MRPVVLSWFFMLGLACVSPVLAAELNLEMRKASQELNALLPYIYDDQAFQNPQNREPIQQRLTRLIQLMETTPDLLERHAVTLELSQQSLLQTLQQARDLYQSGAYATSQFLLSGVPALCSSCHIQDGQQASMVQTMDRKLFANDFSFAEFNYYLRNYSGAREAYLRHLQQPAVQKSQIQANKTLERLLNIAIITADSPRPAQQMLDELEDKAGFTLATRETLKQWQQGLKSLAFSPHDLAQLEAAIFATFNENFTLEHEFIFNEENRPKALLWRRQLHQWLRRDLAPDQVSRALYLLAILERTLGDQLDAALANLYLKECIRRNQAPYANRCLNEYENHLYFYYGGSSGEHLPEPIHQELRALKRELSKEG
ncbi:MAG: hypothetical protein SV765_05555 [Pseudomonadota bacterium]|nr:hypothetical protein [Pseudomonadales bacterium]MDY6919661.1 hypothetical protein [Pseudomonadota bacterium]